MAEQRLQDFVSDPSRADPADGSEVVRLIGAFCPGQSPKQVARFATDRTVWENAWYHTTNAFPEIGVYVIEPDGTLRTTSQNR